MGTTFFFFLVAPLSAHQQQEVVPHHMAEFAKGIYFWAREPLQGGSCFGTDIAWLPIPPQSQFLGQEVKAWCLKVQIILEEGNPTFGDVER